MRDEVDAGDKRQSGQMERGVIKQLEELGKGIENSLLSGDELKLMVASREQKSK